MRYRRLAEIFKNRQRQLYASALSITKNRESAEDAVHDALLAVANIKNEPTNMEAYLFQTVRNKALHQLREQNRLEPFEEDYLDPFEQDESMAVLVEQVKKHISLLNLNEQQTLILKLFEGLKFNEISLILDTPENTIASWYRRGLQKLTEVLNE
ncbi:sigma-70 family RNA polymerase sigma factor [Haliea sp. AH-315-K21]|uniref:RNA polymerase subunit sigma-24 n=1 Tax=SAR86 cluster bacterium TaxID=2030880 RepID=A0A2A5C836_9GAMM|nr:sigma-70 family RNA polymerase sigma factor [Haliea sp. AH-315-K21]MBN4075697.1 sigma-70 family RNA polymerase sigma factor [Gammaproteobacteria bacterium AH-315-E17]PCJ39972.1 MAG: hypothetical protein COA71_12420 [SAR86 cluster bacterium]